MIHLYAIARQRVPLTDIAGVDGAPLRGVGCGPLHAAVSDHPRAPAATRERALAHAAAVAAVCARVAAVPVRYGAQHADEDALSSAVAGQEPSLLAAVRRLGGHVELVVRVSPPSPVARVEAGVPGGGDASGRAYLERRLARERARREAAQVAHAQLRAATRHLADLVVEALDHDGPAGPERCLLVPAGRAEEARRRLSDATPGPTGLVVGGPWPPYSFAGAAA